MRTYWSRVGPWVSVTGVLIRAGPIKAETEGECYVKTETGGISVYKPRDPKECWLSPELGERP